MVIRRYQYLEATAIELLQHAETQISGERVIQTWTMPSEVNGGVDAPGWCRKQSRKLFSLANKKQKNFLHKQEERVKNTRRLERQTNDFEREKS